MVGNAGDRAAPHPTLEMVAAEAGVSRGTASRALNGGHSVSRHALEAVEAAAEKLGYRPNLAARSLVLGRTGSVGLVVSETDERLFTDPYFASVSRAVHSELLRHDVQLVLALAQSSSERERMLRFAAGRHLDGVIIISVHGQDPLPAAIAAAGLPVVIGGAVEGPDRELDRIASVDADNRVGARAAVEHLVRGGRRRIAHIAGPLDMIVSRDRLAGWRTVAGATAGGAGGTLTEPGEFSEASGAAAMRRLLEREPDLDAVFCANDLMARGAIGALRAAGRRVPDDVAVVGFDDLPGADLGEPALTTVRQPVHAMGRLMAKTLLDMVNGRVPDPRHVVVETRLVVRDSA